DAASERAGSLALRARPWLPASHGVGANQAAVLAWGSQMIASTHSPSAAATVEGLRDLVGNALRAAEDHLGDGEPVDEFGFEPEFTSRVLMPVARFFYQRWFRVQIRGLEHVPAAGPGLGVANHSGTLPMDAVMVQTGLDDEHPAGRNLRVPSADLVDEIPLLSALARKSGHIRAAPANADTALRAGELVGVFPEGFKGIGKPFADRYQLRRFGRGGFAAPAHPAGGPLIPRAVLRAGGGFPLLRHATKGP